MHFVVILHNLMLIFTSWIYTKWEKYKQILLENLMGKNNLGDLGLHWRILLKKILQRQYLKWIWLTRQD